MNCQYADGPACNVHKPETVAGFQEDSLATPVRGLQVETRNFCQLVLAAASMQIASMFI